MSNTDPIRLCLPSGLPSHFSLHEFQNDEGLAAVSPLTLAGLELVREELWPNYPNAGYADEVQLIITSALRTEADQERLAKKLGWADEWKDPSTGDWVSAAYARNTWKRGAVSRTSQHLLRHCPKHWPEKCPRDCEFSSATAVDFYVRIKATKKRIPQATVAEVAERYFDWVKADYGDGHVHADMRDGGKKL